MNFQWKHGAGEIWAAGFFDGEGCIYVLKSRRSDPETGRYSCMQYCLSISITQKSDIPLKVIQEIFGGILIAPTPKSKYWKWRIYGDHARNALSKMLPFLTLKQEQAIVAIAFQERRRLKGKRFSSDMRRQKANDRDETDYQLLKYMKL